MTLSQLLIIGVQIAQIIMQLIKTGEQVAPQIIDTFDLWKTLVEAKLNGVDITEEQVKALDSKVLALSDENAAQEDAIIAGKV
jgi:hypothetical protein